MIVDLVAMVCLCTCGACGIDWFCNLQKENVTKELSAYEQTLMNYGRLLGDVRRENIALWVGPQILSETLAAVQCALY